MPRGPPNQPSTHANPQKGSPKDSKVAPRGRPSQPKGSPSRPRGSQSRPKGHPSRPQWRPGLPQVPPESAKEGQKSLKDAPRKPIRCKTRVTDVLFSPSMSGVSSKPFFVKDRLAHSAVASVLLGSACRCMCVRDAPSFGSQRCTKTPSSHSPDLNPRSSIIEIRNQKQNSKKKNKTTQRANASRFHFPRSK